MARWGGPPWRRLSERPACGHANSPTPAPGTRCWDPPRTRRSSVIDSQDLKRLLFFSRRMEIPTRGSDTARDDGPRGNRLPRISQDGLTFQIWPETRRRRLADLRPRASPRAMPSFVAWVGRAVTRAVVAEPSTCGILVAEFGPDVHRPLPADRGGLGPGAAVYDPDPDAHGHQPIRPGAWRFLSDPGGFRRRGSST